MNATAETNNVERIYLVTGCLLQESVCCNHVVQNCHCVCVCACVRVRASTRA